MNGRVHSVEITNYTNVAEHK